MFIGLSLILLSILTQVENKANYLEKINWSNFNYDQLHEFAIRDQVENYQPLFKYTQPGGDRSLDGLYNFCFDYSLEGFKGEWFNKDIRGTCGERNFYRMPVPSAFNDITSTKEAKNYIGWVWYQTTFEIQNSEANFDRFIRFENINYMAAVWIQGNLNDRNDIDMKASFLGAHVGGYLPFAFKIPPGKKFRLTIAVSNILTQDTVPSGKIIDLSKQVGHNFYKFQPDFDFFHFAGIMGKVILSKQSPHFYIKDTEKVHHNGTIITRLTICFNENKQTTTDYFLKVDYFDTGAESIADSERAQIQKGECLKYPSPTMFQSQEQNKLLSIRSMRFQLEYQRDGNDYLEVPVRFQEDHSNSSTLDTKFERNLYHKQSSPLSNHLQGFGMHHEQLFSGRTMSLSSIMKDMYLLKGIGANVIRTSHYPYSPEYLEACDELGIKVIAECQAVGLNTFSDIKLMLHKQLLLEMMQRDDHHPSILMWSVANEPQSNLPAAKGYFESLLKYARKELAKYTVDSGRPLTAAIAQSHLDDKIGHTLDIIMINRYYGWYDYTGVIGAIRLPLIKSLEGWSSVYPSKGLIVSEFGADAVSGLHSVTRGDLFSEEYQRDLLVEYEKVFDEIVCDYNGKINLVGSMIWNFADFSTHESLLRVGGNRKGIFNRDRSPKLAVESVRKIYQSRLNKSCLCEISEGA